MKLILATAAAAALLAGTASATTYVLDFTGSGAVPDDFGDNTEVDLSYRGFVASGWGPGQADSGSVKFWTTGYGDLPGAAWVSPKGARGEIRIEATTATDTVSVDSFQTAGLRGDQLLQWYVYDLAGNLLGFEDNGTAPNPGNVTVMPGLSAEGGVIFQWGEDAWDVGIQNFTFTVGAPSNPATAVTQSNANPTPAPRPPAIPVPAAAPLLLTGAALLGAMQLRRRRG